NERRLIVHQQSSSLVHVNQISVSGISRVLAKNGVIVGCVTGSQFDPRNNRIIGALQPEYVAHVDKAVCGFAQADSVANSPPWYECRACRRECAVVGTTTVMGDRAVSLVESPVRQRPS